MPITMTAFLAITALSLTIYWCVKWWSENDWRDPL